MTVRVLLLGGTGEARRLAATLTAGGVDVVSSLAGRVSAPRLPAGDVRIGGFGGVAGLVAWLTADRVDAVIDATHPFATEITRHAAEATTTLGVPFVVLRRPGWRAGPGDDWRWVDTIADAAARLPALGRRVLLTVGRGDLAPFAPLDLWFVIRAVDPPRPPLPPLHTVLLDRGPFDVAGELAVLREHRIDVLVTKDSGGDLTSAKLVAARELGVPVVVVRRPALPDVPVVSTEADIVRWLATIT